jgi:AcrR family transcriptional regulator
MSRAIRLAKTAELVRLPLEAAKRGGKRADRKRELAEHAIAALGSLGYARTSLRDIAAQSGVSLGVLHYYFEDKIDLISYCVKIYKDTFVATLDAIMAMDIPSDAIAAGVVDGLVASVAEHANTHRLWYDIRGQALFDEAFRPVVGEIEDALIGLVGRLLGRLQVETESPVAVYLRVDGLFRYYLQRRLFGDVDALADFRAALGDEFAALAARRA